MHGNAGTSFYFRPNGFYPNAVTAQSFSLPSFAKINLGLRVGGKRPDGFHEVLTLFQTVSLHDTLSFELSDELTLECDDPAIPTDERNLILRAAKLLADHTGTQIAARIRLVKRIPWPGGLGGGSSNAIVALIGLTRLWNINVDIAIYVKIAAALGSDVPFFLFGGTAIGSGRGTDIEPVRDVGAKYIVIVTPQIAVSTAEAFNALSRDTLTKAAADRILRVCRSSTGSFDSYLRTMENDFENTVFAAHPEIGEVKNTLLELGATSALMSGSGASVFGLFDTEETRQTAMKALDDHVNWRKFAVATISRKQYREALNLVF